MSIAKSASIRQAHWDCPLGETTQTRGSNFWALRRYSEDSSCRRARASTRCDTRTARTCWPAVYHWRRCPRVWGMGRYGRRRKFIVT